jgi:hypothetical protein
VDPESAWFGYRLTIELRGDKTATVRREGGLVLANVRATHNTKLGSLACILTRAEILGHVLFWVSSATNRVVLIELPRLELRFEPRRWTEIALTNLREIVTTRLASVDLDGFYLSDKPLSAELRRQVRGIPHALLLVDANGEASVLVPVARLHRPVYKDSPFSTALVVDRPSAWRLRSTQRVFQYTLHASGSFLASPTLGSSIYLLNLRLLQRDYTAAVRLVEGCFSDKPLPPQDLDLLKQCLAGTASDKHPDAIALRLKAALLTRDSGDFPSLDPAYTRESLLGDYDAYLLRLGHVSRLCRLSYEAEVDVIRLANPFSGPGRPPSTMGDSLGLSGDMLANRGRYLSAIFRHRGRSLKAELMRDTSSQMNDADRSLIDSRHPLTSSVDRQSREFPGAESLEIAFVKVELDPRDELVRHLAG